MTEPNRTQLRLKSLNARKSIPSDKKKKFSMQVCQHIQTLPIYQHAKTIALYHATPHEIDLTLLQQHAERSEKTCYFPKIQTNQTLIFLPETSSTATKKNKFNIIEPIISSRYALPPEAFDIIFIPLIAFDNHGTRLGYGQGYYDRTLAGKKPQALIGVAFEAQCQPFIPRASWDIPLSVIITEEGIHWID